MLFVTIYEAVTRMRMMTAAFVKLYFLLKNSVGSGSIFKREKYFPLKVNVVLKF